MHPYSQSLSTIIRLLLSLLSTLYLTVPLTLTLTLAHPAPFPVPAPTPLPDHRPRLPTLGSNGYSFLNIYLFHSSDCTGPHYDYINIPYNGLFATPMMRGFQSVIMSRVLEPYVPPPKPSPPIPAGPPSPPLLLVVHRAGGTG